MWVDSRTHVNQSLYNLLICCSNTNKLDFTCVHSNPLMQATNMLIFILIYGQTGDYKNNGGTSLHISCTADLYN